MDEFYFPRIYPSRWSPTGRHRVIWPQMSTNKPLHQDEYINEYGEAEWRIRDERDHRTREDCP